MIGLGHRGFPLLKADWHIARWFSQHGYESVLCGIEHTGHGIESTLYDRIPVTANVTETREVPEAAAAYLGSRPERPFFLSVGLHEAHRNYPQPDPEHHPAEDARYVLPPRPLPDVPEIRADMAAYIAMVRRMDEHIGIVLDALDSSGLAERTLVFVFADHGLQFPRNMCSLTDRGLGVFLIARGPGGFQGGLVEDRMVSLLDLYPTACTAANRPLPPWLEGRPLQNLHGNNQQVHDVLFGEMNFHAAYEPARSVRTQRYKYIRRYINREEPVWPNSDPGLTDSWLKANGWSDLRADQEALFDLFFDPDEMDNRINDPTLQGVRKELGNRLNSWMERSDDPLLHGKPLPVPSGAVANHPDDPTWKLSPRPVSELGI